MGCRTAFRQMSFVTANIGNNRKRKRQLQKVAVFGFT